MQVLEQYEKLQAIAEKLQAIAELPEGEPKRWSRAEGISGKNQQFPHDLLRVAPVGVIHVEAEEGLYRASGGCGTGVYIAKIFKQSIFKYAEPPVPEKSFLERVDDVALDSFGTGRNPHYLGDPVVFQNLLALRRSLDDPVSFTICKNGKVSQHTASLKWRSEYTAGVPFIQEPEFEPKIREYECFAGACVMQMTLNFVADGLGSELVGGAETRSLLQYADPQHQVQSHLVINYVDQGTYTHRVIKPGMIVKSVNGVKVNTLDEFKRHFVPSQDLSSKGPCSKPVPKLKPHDTWSLVTNQDVPLVVILKEELENAKLQHASHRFTPTVREAAKCVR